VTCRRPGGASARSILQTGLLSGQSHVAPPPSEVIPLRTQPGAVGLQGTR
jgi:hypothetical protein